VNGVHYYYDLTEALAGKADVAFFLGSRPGPALRRRICPRTC